MRESLVSLVIQGPLHEKTIKQLECNTEYFAEIIVSTWEPRNEAEVNLLETLKILESKNDRLHIVVAGMPNISDSPLPHNFYLQVVSTLNAVSRASGETVIKTRSDEYMDLGSFQKFVEKSPFLFQFGNFIIRDWFYHSFHISDHLYAATKANLLISLRWLLEVDMVEIKKLLGKDWDCPESLLGLSLLKAVFPDFDNSDSPRKTFSIFKANFDLFDLELLDSYEVRANSAGTGYQKTIARMPLESANLINWNYFTKINQMRPSKTNTFFRKRIQPFCRQVFLKWKHRFQDSRRGLGDAHLR